MDSIGEQDSKKPSDTTNSTTSKRRKNVPNLPLLPRLNVKIEPIVLDESMGNNNKNAGGKKYSDTNKSKKLNRKHHPNVKILSTKGLFSEGFQSELKVDAKPSDVSSSKSLKKTTTRRGGANNETDQIKQELIQSNNITLIDETKELANIIQEYGEFFPVALPLTTKLNAIIHENDTNEEDDKSVVLNTDFKIPSHQNYSEAFSLLMDNSNQTPSKDNYFLFQIPASYSTITNKYNESTDNVQGQDINPEDDFDFNGENIVNPYFINETDSFDSLHGFLEMTESGQVRLQIGNETYSVDDAMKSCFLQELYVTELDPSIDEDPMIAKIGRISNKFVCSWHLENSTDEFE